jgi:hypothetical protein
MYGSEVWTLSQGAAYEIDSFKRKSFERYLDPPSPNVCGELGTMIRSIKCARILPLSTYIRLKRLMWAGHVVRMEQHRIPKKVLGSCFGGGRLVRRPRNRWEDVIQRDTANLLRIWNWKSVARDKE